LIENLELSPRLSWESLCGAAEREDLLGEQSESPKSQAKVALDFYQAAKAIK